MKSRGLTGFVGLFVLGLATSAWAEPPKTKGAAKVAAVTSKQLKPKLAKPAAAKPKLAKPAAAKSKPAKLAKPVTAKPKKPMPRSHVQWPPPEGNPGIATPKVPTPRAPDAPTKPTAPRAPLMPSKPTSSPDPTAPGKPATASSSSEPAPEASAVPAAPVATKTVVSASLGSTTVSGGAIDNASRVVAGFRSTAVGCWQSPTPPASAGTSIPIRITLAIDATGKVSKVSLSGGTGATKATLACLVDKFGQAQFSAPSKGTATVMVPLTYVVK